MKIYIDILLLAVVVVYIVDLSGFSQALLGRLSAFIGRKVTSFRPFTCSLCMVWWCSLAYALFAGEFSLPVVAYSAVMSFLAYPLGVLLNVAKALLLALIGLLDIVTQKIDKI